MDVISARMRAAYDVYSAVRQFFLESRYAERRTEPEISDFTFGNPNEYPLDGLVQAIRRGAVPQNAQWYAYKTSEPEPLAFLADIVSREIGLEFEPGSIGLTTGAFAAMAVAFRMVLDPGDEVVFAEPAWFCYEPMLHLADAVPVKVRLTVPTFDLDLAAIDAAIGAKTRMVIVNTPHNPTGRIYSFEMLKELAVLLERASARFGRRIFLLSDEPYRRLRFDENAFTSPATLYPWTFISYSYGKVLLAPGQRIGYLAISPLMPKEDRQAFREVLFTAQVGMGWCFPNAVMQYALPDLENLSIDVDTLTRKRERLSLALSEAGCRVLRPEGTFYLWSRWPEGNPEELCGRLADRDVFVMPGRIMGSPDYFPH